MIGTGLQVPCYGGEWLDYANKEHKEFMMGGNNEQLSAGHLALQSAGEHVQVLGPLLSRYHASF